MDYLVSRKRRPPAVSALFALVLCGAASGSTVQIGTGTGTWEHPMNTYWHDARTQVIYLASEVGTGGLITSLALDVATIPGQTMTNWTIRMKTTALSSYSSATWDGSGWTTVYQASAAPGATGWRTFTFTTPFNYNGTSNLMIDFSFNNSSYTSSGYCRYSVPGGNRSLYAYTDSGYGDPLTWSGTTAYPSYTTLVPNIRLNIAGSVSGVVYNDVNNDGAWQSPSEPGISGRTVYLDANNNGVLDGGETNLFTGSGGTYTFNLFTPGTYYVREVVPTYWAQTDPAGGAAQTVNFTGAETFTNINFGVYSVAESGPPDTPDLVAASDTGLSSSDNLTNLNNSNPGSVLQFTVTGTIPGALVTVFRDGTPMGSATATGLSTTITTSPGTTMADGLRVVTARQTQSGKWESPPSGGLNVTVDTVQPGPCSLDLQALSDSGVSNTDNITSDSTPTFDIIASPYFRILRDGTQISGSYLSGATYTPPLQADGTYTYSIVAQDAAGNESTGAGLLVTIDTVAPPVPSAPVLQAASDSGLSSSDGITNINTPTFDVAAAPYFRFYRFATLISTPYESGASYTIPAQADAAYYYGYKVSAVDDAGNASALSTGASVVIDTVPPAASAQVDPTFGGGHVRTAVAGAARARAVAVQPDGKIVAAGAAHNGANWDFAAVRYNADGSLDTGFGAGGIVLLDLGAGDDEVFGMALQPDGKVILAGNTSDAGGYNDGAVARLNADGSLDTSFGSGGKTIFSWGTTEDVVRAVVLQLDGKIVLGGASATTFNGSDFALARLNADGTFDTTFGTFGKVTTYLSSGTDGIFALALQPDGKIVAAGEAENFNVQAFGAARYTVTGTLDAGFFGGTRILSIGDSTRPAAARTVVVRADGSVVLAGYAPETANGATRDDLGLIFLSSTGALTATQLWKPSAQNDVGTAMAINGNGKLLVAGRSGYGGAANEFRLTRFNGTLGIEQTASAGFAEGTQLGAQALAIQPDGKIVLAGDSGGSFALVRFFPDPTFYNPLTLQAASDSGVSNTDKLTNAQAPVFDVISPGPYFRIYDNGALAADFATGSTFQIFDPAEGLHDYQLANVDVAGNESALMAGGNHTFDRTPPAAPAVGGTTPNSSAQPTWSWTAGGGGNGAFRYQLDGTGAAWTPTTALSFSPGSGLTEGAHELFVQEIDDAGNWSLSGQFAITVDALPPQAPLVSGPAISNSATPIWTWVTDGGGNGSFRYQLDGTSGAWTPVAGTAFTPDTVLADGIHTLYVQETDIFSRWSTAGSFTVLVDTQAPAAPVVSGTSPTTDKTPAWTWTSGGGGNGTFRYQLDGTAGAWTATTALSFTPAQDLSHALHTLYVQEGDAAGNWSATSQAAILIGNAPLVSATAAPASGVAPLTVAFTSLAGDADGDTLSYAWDFGDGGNSSQQNPAHIYSNAGVYTATLTVSDSLNEVGVSTVKITVTSGEGALPVVARASSTTGAAPLAVSFVSLTDDAAGGALSFAWDFGDGSTSTLQNPTHIYTVAGTYTATVTITNSLNHNGVSSVAIVVAGGDGSLPAAAAADDDGDGFSNEVETALGSNAQGASSHPLNLAQIQNAGPLSVAKLGVKLNFAKAGSDSISLSGALLIPEGFSIAGKMVIANVGGVVRGFELNAKGGAKIGSDAVAIGVKSVKGRTRLQVAKLALKLTKGSFATELSDDGLVNDTVTTRVQVPVTLIFNDTLLQSVVPQSYKAAAGKGGASK